MKRILMLLMAVVALMVVMLAMSVAPAFARGCAFGSTGYYASNFKCLGRE